MDTAFTRWMSEQDFPLGACGIWITPAPSDRGAHPGILFARISEPELVAFRKQIGVAASDEGLHHVSGASIVANGREVARIWCARQGDQTTMNGIRDGTIRPEDYK